MESERLGNAVIAACLMQRVNLSDLQGTRGLAITGISCAVALVVVLSEVNLIPIDAEVQLSVECSVFAGIM